MQLVVGSTKIFRYVSATILRKLTNITISEEADVNFANALCKFFLLLFMLKIVNY